MFDADAASISLPDNLCEAYPLDDLLLGLLDASLTGIALYSPIRGVGGEIVDFTIDLLNPAAQRILEQPARPGGTYLQHYPHTLETGVFAFHRDAFESGQPSRLDVNYQGDGLDNYFRLSARRVGKGLLVSFSDTADASRTAVEVALRESQAREKDARAAAERQRNQLEALLHQAPVAIGFFEGPELRITAVNPLMCAIWGRAKDEVLGLPLLEALPELQGQGFDTLMTQVMETQAPVVGSEAPATMWRDGKLVTTYYNFVYQPFYDEQGALQGVIDVAVEVTEQVKARQLIEEKERQTNQLNEEIRANNAALEQAQQALRQLNEELEARVVERTQAMMAALAETERQREQLRKQQQNLRQILSQVPASVATLAGPDHRYTFFNGSYLALTGGRPQLGHTVAEVLPEVVAQGFGRLLDEVYTTGKTMHGVEQPLLLQKTAAETEQRYIDFVYQPLLDEQAKPQGILAFIVDTTDKVLGRQQAAAAQAQAIAAAQQLAAQRETFYQVFEQTPALIYIARGANHRIDYVNPEYQALFPGRTLVGLTTAEAIPVSVERGFVKLLDQVYQTGEPYFGNEVPITTHDDAGQPHQRYLNFTYQANRENGEIIGVSSFAFDVSEQVAARRQQAAQQAQLANLFEQAPVAVAILQGPAYVIEVANPLIASIWGRSQEQVLGRPLFEALPEAREQGFQELLDQVVTTGEAFVAHEVAALLGPKGQLETVYLNFVYQPLRDGHGRLTSVAAVATDVTEQVLARRRVEDSQQQIQHLNEELAAANEKLLTSNNELGEANQQLRRINVDLDNFIYTASHDLKAPISNIEGLLLALREELAHAPMPLQVPALLELMQGSVERFKHTIDQLTDVTKLQKAYDQPTIDVALALVVAAVRLDLLPQLEAAGGQLMVEVPADQLVAFSEKNLRSVVYNLLSNALKYRQAERPLQVQVRSYLTPGYTVLEVQDNGLGLSPGQHAKLFGMFQRMHDHVEGSGIGLYMVKKIVDNAGGHIEVESQLGVGSCFRVFFPAGKSLPPA